MTLFSFLLSLSYFYLQTVTTTVYNDVCAPCNHGTQCSSGLCAFADANKKVGFCTQRCNDDGECPKPMMCQSTGDSTNIKICSPRDANTSCSEVYQGVVLNELCINVPSTGNPNSGFSRDCQNGLVCFVYPSRVGACLKPCSVIEPVQGCPLGSRCCYGIDANQKCLGPSSTRAIGACFKHRVLGDSCVQADESVCGDGMICYSSTTPDQAQCYGTCATRTCSYFEQCIGSPSGYSQTGRPNLCCDINVLNQNICLPHPAPCLRNLGMPCTQDTQCLSTLCQKQGELSYCSAPCQTQEDCLSLNSNYATVTECAELSGQKRCVLKGPPQELPACAHRAAVIASSDPQGCNCNTQPALATPVLLIGLNLFLRKISSSRLKKS